MLSAEISNNILTFSGGILRLHYRGPIGVRLSWAVPCERIAHVHLADRLVVTAVTGEAFEVWARTQPDDYRLLNAFTDNFLTAWEAYRADAKNHA